MRPGVSGRQLCVKTRAAFNPAGSEKYDYIVVGGGTAGCVLANRLTADGTKSVLVLEAGVNGGPLETRVPAGLTRLFRHPVLDWNLFTVVQPQLRREVYNARGKLLGGSSATNATLYHRGTAADYDSWGLEGWSSQEVLDWYKRAECNKDAGSSKYHGQEGIMNVENPRYSSKLHEEFFGSAAAIGLPANNDFNDWSRPQEGYGTFQVTQQRGARADMYQQYLKPALGRSNLKVITGARTTQIFTERNSEGVAARGVQFSVDGPGGERFAAETKAGGEVLLCTGAVQSPQLLMLSGIGPADTLREHNIDVVVESSGVGQNLQDHPAALWASLIKPEHGNLTVTSQIYNKSNNIRLDAILNYLIWRKGPLATTGCDRGAFISTTGSGEPDLQMRFVNGYSLDPNGVDAYVKFGKLKEEGRNWPDGVTIQLLGIRPKSRGTVGLKSADPFTLPALNTAYFTDKDGADMATLVAGIKLSREMASKGPLGQYISEESFPGPARQSDADLEAYIRSTVHSGNALVGSCRMGTSLEEGAVVSSRDMRVFGVNGLRVVDASVLPTLPGGQSGAATVMVAERVAAALTATSERGRVMTGSSSVYTQSATPVGV